MFIDFYNDLYNKCLNLILGIAVIIFICWPESSHAALLAGIGKADITPPIGTQMVGYPNPPLCTGIHDPLYAKALVLYDSTTKLAIVSVDTANIYNDYAGRGTNLVRSLVRSGGSDIENIILVATHTHSGPFVQFWPSDMERKIANAIIQAASNLVPAKIGVGRGSVDEAFNRRWVRPDGTVWVVFTNPTRDPKYGGLIDREVGVIAVKKFDGTPLATLVNYGAHAVTWPTNNSLISADYPGVTAQVVESNPNGGQCMFLQGAEGDVDPYATWQGYTSAIGTNLGNEVMRVMGLITEYDANPVLSFHTQYITLDTRDHYFREQPSTSAEISTVLLGNKIALAAFPGEMFSESSFYLKKYSLIENTFLLSLCNDSMGYFPPIHACVEGGYGTTTAGNMVTEIGSGEWLVNRALINLCYQVKLIPISP
jgi:neutral ceramidase